jgi:integrase
MDAIRPAPRLTADPSRIVPPDPLGADTSLSCLRQALAAAGTERRVTVHGLRRTVVVLLQDAGAPDSVIRQALGHAQ